MFAIQTLWGLGRAGNRRRVAAHAVGGKPLGRPKEGGNGSALRGMGVFLTGTEEQRDRQQE